MTFPNPPVATERVYRITQRQVDQRGLRGHAKTSAPGGSIVTAGDGNMVPVDHIGHPRQAPKWSLSTYQTQGSHYGSRRRDDQMSARTPEAEPLLTPAEVATM